jgi:ribosomal protein S12 methylthiotransferase
MKRPAAAEKTLTRIQAWRSICPDITIRSTFIAGFPGETEAEFQELLDFLEEAQLDRVGCFAYSPVEGATANAFEGHVPEELKQQRVARFMAAQAKISAAKLQRKVGLTMDVVIDAITPTSAVGRSKADAPEIDGQVLVKGLHQHQVGDIVKVNITAADAHDLQAKWI